MKNVRKVLFMLSAVIVLSGFGPCFLAGNNNISSVEAKKAKLSRKTLVLKVGKTFRLRVKHKKRTVTWLSTNPKIATVVNGRVTAKKPGKCFIIAKHKKRRLKCSVTVRSAVFKVSDTNIKLKKKKGKTVLVTSERQSAITITTSNKYIATGSPLYGPGEVIPIRISAGKTAGKAVITVTEKKSGKKRVIHVTVKGKNAFRLNKKSDARIKLKTGETKCIMIRCDSMLSPGFRLSNPNPKKPAVYCRWGKKWHGKLIPFRITGKNAGTGWAVITFREPSSKKKITVKVRVVNR